MDESQCLMINNIHQQMLRGGLYASHDPLQQLPVLLGTLGFEDCVVYQSRNKWLTQVAAFGPKHCCRAGVRKPIVLPFDQGVVGYTARHLAITLINEAAFDSRYVVDDQPRQSELAMALIRHGRLVGVVDSEHPEPYYFTRQHIDRLMGALVVLGFEPPRQGEEPERPLVKEVSPIGTKGHLSSADESSISSALLSGLKSFTDSTQLKSLLIRQPILRSQVHTVEQFRALIQRTAMRYSEQIKTQKYHAILKLTYFVPVSSGQLIAERLHMGYSTYRRHLAKARNMLITDVMEQLMSLPMEVPRPRSIRSATR